MRRIMIDASKCDGCKNCELACMNAHRKDGGTSIYTLDLSDPENVSRNHIKKSKEGYKPIFCRHCAVPNCANSCMSGALQKDNESGLVTYDSEPCGSCFMCVMNCPFGTMKPYTNATYIVKCDFCKEHGLEPSCVKSCPKEAIWVSEV